MRIGRDVPPDDPSYGTYLYGPNLWPNLPEDEFKKPIMKYRQYMLQLAEEIMKILARGLPDGRDVFIDFMRDPVASAKLLHYPPQAQAGEEAVGGWGALNTYTASILGDFRTKHKQCHTVIDTASVVGGVWLKELVGFLYLIGFVLVSGSGILGVSIAVNALSNHGACTPWWSFLATVVVTLLASIRTFQRIGWITWAGFASIFIAVLIVVVGMTTRDRPASAPQTDDYDSGYHVIGHPNFIAGMTASATIFVSSSGTSSFMPVIAEMKNPRDYKKALFTCMAILNAAYLSFSLVVYRWCGKWVANPSLGGSPVVKKVAYGIGLIGLAVSGCLYLHANTVVHWGTWLGCTVVLGVVAFILASAIPIFNFLLALTGSICFSPLAVILPNIFWIYDHADYLRRSIGRKAVFVFHVLLILIGRTLSVGGTYSTVKLIIGAYKVGNIGIVLALTLVDLSALRICILMCRQLEFLLDGSLVTDLERVGIDLARLSTLDSTQP
ncbi:uncharacterized protein Z518_06142 [Rhinocladiella mackenziei CBS 650.93]|uniref:Amino acid transporter transmembrane domain-containing protein n=1 Tax=Rhinocladiella mackenziei CBS 650.93 TaxID=1442369 RepID=A0A0D2J870_9EURO|nr:uncharacterized protein Z518_06142 [Rhinocladiella mackenziei CBS 650.93]KIX05270.1 hypothetical protein Z518_06142 [Rhinocladiella mackenziei CBS 650.93]